MWTRRSGNWVCHREGTTSCQPLRADARQRWQSAECLGLRLKKVQGLSYSASQRTSHASGFQNFQVHRPYLRGRGGSAVRLQTRPRGLLSMGPRTFTESLTLRINPISPLKLYNDPFWKAQEGRDYSRRWHLGFMFHCSRRTDLQNKQDVYPQLCRFASHFL